MSPETAAYLARAEDMLARAELMRGVGLSQDAGRAAYLAAFHAAQALLFAKLGKVFRTHSGVHSEFARLTSGEGSFDRALRGFLSKSYDLKVVADYEGGPDNQIAPVLAEVAAAEARLFVDAVTVLLGTSEQKP